MKKQLIIMAVIIIILVSVIFVWQGMKKNSKQARKALPSMEQKNQKQIEKADATNWKIYRDEKYGFEIKYPNNWEFVIRNTKKDKSGVEGFFLQKDNNNYFGIFPTGGFSHGIPEPKIISAEKFKNKEAKTYWYDYPFPVYINIINNLPKNWNPNNLIEIRISTSDQETIELMQGIYNSFDFVE